MGNIIRDINIAIIIDSSKSNSSTEFPIKVFLIKINLK